MTRTFPCIVVGLLLIVQGVVCGAQESELSEGPATIGGLTFKDEIELTVVNLAVYVSDKDGLAVTDLEAEDFLVMQDGQERQISNFALYTNEMFRHRVASENSLVPPTPLPENIDSADQVPELRPVHVVLYVDNENLHPLDRNRVLRQLREFIHENLYEPVQMMVVTYQKSLKVVQPFTSDQSAILAALRGQFMHTGGRRSLDQSRKDILTRMQRYRQDSGQSDVQSYHRMNAEMQAFAENVVNDLAFTLTSLRQTITTLSGLPGKKSLIYISNGLPMVAGQELFYAFANAYNDPSAVTMSAQYDQTRQFRSLVATANAQNVSLYTIGAGGLDYVGMATAEYSTPQDTISASVGDQNYMDSLRYMAESTGGSAILNTNDISEAMEKVSQDFFTYYSVGYLLNTTGGDKVHKIDVKLPNHSDYSVRYRRRMVEKSLESRVQDKVVTALMFDLDDNPMQVDLVCGNPAPASEDRWIVPIEISFPLRKLALLPEGEDYVGRVVLFIAARDTEGRQSDIVRQEHEVRLPAADYEEAQRNRFTISASMLMEDGSFRVVVGLFDQLTRQSSYRSAQKIIRSSD